MTDTLTDAVRAELAHTLEGTTKADLSRSLAIFAYRNGLDADTATSDVDRENRRVELADIAAAAAAEMSAGTLAPASEQVKARKVPSRSLGEMLGIDDMTAALSGAPDPAPPVPEGDDEEPEYEEV